LQVILEDLLLHLLTLQPVFGCCCDDICSILPLLPPTADVQDLLSQGIHTTAAAVVMLLLAIRSCCMQTLAGVVGTTLFVHCCAAAPVAGLLLVLVFMLQRRRACKAEILSRRCRAESMAG
jgi:hypothetical protein